MRALFCAVVALGVTAAGTSGAAAAGERHVGLLRATLSPGKLRGGETARLHLALNRPAPAGGARVTLASDHPEVLPLPATVTIPAGQRAIGISVTTRQVDAPVIIHVRGDDGRRTRRDRLQVRP
jgi:hypothetical protein